MSHEQDILALEALLASLPDSEADWESAHENDNTAVTFYENMLKVLPLPERVNPHPYETRHEVYVTETPDGDTVTYTVDGETVFEGYGIGAFIQIFEMVGPRKMDKLIFDKSCKIVLGEPEDTGLLGKEFTNLPHPYHKVRYENYYGHKRHTSIFRYITHLQVTLQYLRNPEDFYNAYQWVQHHVMFWTVNEDGYTKHNLSGSGYEPYMCVMKTSDTKETVIALEVGESLGEITCHDHSLDVYAPTFEEAYIKLATRIHETYTWDGVRREGK